MGEEDTGTELPSPVLNTHSQREMQAAGEISNTKTLIDPGSSILLFTLAPEVLSSWDFAALFASCCS